MAVIAGTDTAEQNFVNAYSSLMYNPTTAGNPYSVPGSGYGLTFWGISQVLSDMTQAGEE